MYFICSACICMDCYYFIIRKTDIPNHIVVNKSESILVVSDQIRAFLYDFYIRKMRTLLNTGTIDINDQ